MYCHHNNVIMATVNGDKKIYCNEGCGLLTPVSLHNPRPRFSMGRTRSRKRPVISTVNDIKTINMELSK